MTSAWRIERVERNVPPYLSFRTSDEFMGELIHRLQTTARLATKDPNLENKTCGTGMKVIIIGRDLAPGMATI